MRLSVLFAKLDGLGPVGAVAKALLAEFDVQVLSHSVAVGPVHLERPVEWPELVALSRCLLYTSRCV